jgi:hypothetical protein
MTRLFTCCFLLIATHACFAQEPALALRDGEMLTYRVAWAIVPGAGEIKISAKKEIGPDAPQLRVTTTTATRGFARMLMAFDAQAESVFDVRSGRLLTLTERSTSRRKHAEHTVTFDYPKGQALYIAKENPTTPVPLPLPDGNPTDLITSLLQTRSWDLKPGEARDALVLFDDDFYELTIHALRYENVKTSLGTFHTVVLEPRMEKTPPKGMFKRGSTVLVWIAQDDHRLPVRFEVEFKIGTGVATLVGYHPPTEAASTTESTSGSAKNSHP